jgi:FG-GAP-like repeat/Abnormal spindle-like microcephaly-assoc'd, ASPM-SPD-2-Hydin
MGASVRTACVVIALLALACGGQPLSGQSPNPVPLINNPLVPTSVAPGGPGFTLTVNGTGFVSGATIKWNGAALTTAFVSGSQLTATVPAANIATATTAVITVSNPTPGGGTSNVAYFAITSPAPVLTFTTINPNTAPVETVGPLLAFGTNPLASVPVFAVGDFNGDGKLDIAVPQNTGTSVSVQLGNGDGSFGPAVNYTVGCGPTFVLAADFNGDGKLDLAVAKSDSSVSILLGTGDGTFQNARPISLGFAGPNPCSTSNSIMYLAAADLNGDGKLDLAVPLSTTVEILLGNGDGSFQTPAEYNSGVAPNFYSPFGIAVGDFNSDGKLDLAIPFAIPVFATRALGPAVTILLGNGDGSFQTPTPLFLSVADVATGMAVADVNGDGKLDLVFGGLDGTPSVALGNGNGTFQSPVETGFPVATYAFALGDFTANGKLDMALPDATNRMVSIALGDGASSFVNPPLSIPCAVPDGAIVAGDFNGDGKLDLVLTNFLSAKSTTSTVTTLLQGSFPSFSAAPNPLVFPQQAVGTTSPSQTIVLTNSGLAPFSISAIMVAGANPSEFAQTNNCIVSLNPAATCQVTVTFAPTQQGNPTAVLSVSDDAPGGPHSISIQGSVTPPPPPPPAPVVSLSPSTITFPAQYVGASGLPQTVTVTNTGNATLAITAATASPADFGVLSNCSNPLAAGSNCTIGVFFDPTAGGTRTGTLKITDNAGDSPQSVTLTGSGLDFSMTPGAAASATVTAGQTASYSIAVAPAGGFAASVALSCSGGPAGSACAVSPSTIALSGAAAQTAMVTVTTVAHGWLLPFRGGWPKDARYRQTPMILTFAAMFLLMVVASQFLRRERNFTWVRVLGFAALLTLGLTLTSCGGGSGSGGGGTNPQAGTYTVTVTGNFTSGSTTLTHAAKLTLVVQ